MLNQHAGSSEILVTAVFYESFTAANAIKALTGAGFEDTDIDLIGVLAGSLPRLDWLCDFGVPAEHALYFQTCFEDGGVLLAVRARHWIEKQIAVTVLEQQGGILPPRPYPALEIVAL